MTTEDNAMESGQPSPETVPLRDSPSGRKLMKPLLQDLVSLLGDNLDLPSETLTSFGSDFLRLLKEMEQMKKYIEKESDMRGDYNTYLRVCMENETRSTVGRIKCVQKLRSDFDEKRIIYKKELKGLKDQITTMKGRNLMYAWSSDKKALINAALERYQNLVAVDMRAIGNTDAAIQELRTYRQQIPKLSDDAELILKTYNTLKKLIRILEKKAVPGMNDDASKKIWNAILTMLQWKSTSEVVDQTAKTLRDYKALKTKEESSRKNEWNRLNALLDRTSHLLEDDFDTSSVQTKSNEKLSANPEERIGHSTSDGFEICADSLKYIFKERKPGFKDSDDESIGTSSILSAEGERKRKSLYNERSLQSDMGKKVRQQRTQARSSMYARMTSKENIRGSRGPNQGLNKQKKPGLSSILGDKTHNGGKASENRPVKRHASLYQSRDPSGVQQIFHAVFKV